MKKQLFLVAFMLVLGMTENALGLSFIKSNDSKKTKDNQTAPSTVVAVDLGLSVKWASHNVGASKPEEYGGYFAWGETEQKPSYAKETYKYYQNGTFVNIGSNISGTRYDVARAKWGGKWRIPTRAEIKELVENCDYEWTTLNGVKGGKFTSKKNGNSIFLPAAGGRWGGALSGEGKGGGYWSATLYDESSTRGANGLFFKEGSRNYNGAWGRHTGHTIRPVSD